MSATCTEGAAEVHDIHEAVPGKLCEVPEPGLPPGVKFGASWVPSGCPVPPSAILGQEPAPDLASIPVDLFFVPSHTARS